MTQIIDHGKWVSYQPDQLPPEAPPNAMFCRRESDGVDWYDYVRDPESFTADGVKFTAVWQDIYNGFTVGAAVRDPARLFPAGQLVREIIDYRGGDPQTELGNRLYEPNTHRLRDPPPPPPHPSQPLFDRLQAFDFDGLETQLAVLEARVAQLEDKLERVLR
jgi:hypothetical protein